MRPSDPLESYVVRACRKEAARAGVRIVRLRPPPVGIQDYLLLGPGGQHALVEFKTRTGSVRPMQVVWARWAEEHGHTRAVVRGLSEFRELLKKFLTKG